MSSFVLKLIAIITMFIDHFAVVFIPWSSDLYIPLRLIGRLAFPIFAFLLVEGFYHTRNIKKYLTRLGIFAVISEVIFDLAFYKTYFYKEHQNIYFTLFLGLLTIYLMSMTERKFQNNLLLVNLINAGITLVSCFIAQFLNFDYRFMGILLIIAFYLFRGKKFLLALTMLVLSGDLIQAFYIFAMIPIAFYNGKKGRNIKYFFYVFYPAHLLVLYIARLLI